MFRNMGKRADSRKQRAHSLNRTQRITQIAYIFTLLSFVLPIGFIILRIIDAPATAPVGAANVRIKSDYVLMLVECLLGVVVIHLPSLLEHRFHFELPAALYLLYILFLYCAIFLGEVRDFYYAVPHWDTILHAMSSVMAGVFGFTVVATLNRNDRIAIALSPSFVALFAFCFAVTLGTLWEIYEFTGDGLLNMNMQKFRTADGTVLVGHAALGDTMKDIIVDTLGALFASVAGYFSLRIKRGWASEIITQYCDKRDASAKPSVAKTGTE